MPRTYGGPLPDYQAPLPVRFNPGFGCLYSGVLKVASSPFQVLDGPGYLASIFATITTGASLSNGIFCYDLAGAAAAPTAVDSGVAGNVNGTNFQYYVEFIDFGGKAISTIGVKSTALSVTNKKVNLTGIPIGPPGTAKRQLYRNKTGGGTWYKLDTINDNVTTTYQDNIADASITVAYASPVSDANCIFKICLVANGTYTQSTFDAPIFYKYGLYVEVVGATNEGAVYYMGD